jgi:chromosome partitioning protein
VVLGNEKGGSGKSTLAMHVAAALMNAGQRVATIDLDSRQKSFTRYIEFRRDWAKRTRVDLKIPTHACVARGATLKLDDNEAIEAAQFADAISAVEQSHDFVVIDTPGADTHLARLAHSLADTLITPLNDSFVDFDVLGTLDPINLVVTGEGPYAQMVRDARRRRREIDFVRMDWIVVRNRMSQTGARRDGLLGEGLEQLAARLGFRCLEGFAERVIYRELFPRGLTALDAPAAGEPGNATAAMHAGAQHASVQQEVLRLVDGLKLPLNAEGRRRAAARQEWFAAQDTPLELHDVIGT